MSKATEQVASAVAATLVQFGEGLDGLRRPVGASGGALVVSQVRTLLGVVEVTINGVPFLLHVTEGEL